jgi:aryl-alcohol dehydrogenase-like predicted oxidoreductase
VQTKFTSLDGQDLTKPIPYDAKAKVEDQVDQSVAASLEQLGVDYIDCLVMHSPMRTKDVSCYPPPLALPSVKVSVANTAYLSPHRKPFAHGDNWSSITIVGF